METKFINLKCLQMKSPQTYLLMASGQRNLLGDWAMKVIVEHLCSKLASVGAPAPHTGLTGVPPTAASHHK